MAIPQRSETGEVISANLLTLIFIFTHIYHFRKVNENQFIWAITSFITQYVEWLQKGERFHLNSQGPSLRWGWPIQAQEHFVHWLLPPPV